MLRFAYLLVCVFWVACNASYGQTEVLNFKIDTKYPRAKKAIYSLTNTITNHLAVLIADRKKIHANLVDSNFNVVSQFSFDAPKRKYLDPLGYSSNQNTFHLLYANGGFSDFILVSVAFDSKSSVQKELNFKLKDDEVYIDTIINNNELYFISSNKDAIIIRTLSKNALTVVKTINTKHFSNVNFLSPSYNFWEFLSGQIQESNITKIDHRVPISIDQASEPNKLYKIDNTIVLSFEDSKNKKGTFLYKLDLSTLHIEELMFEYPKGRIDEFKKHNSFIYDNKIFQLASSKQEMNFSIKAMDNTLIKEFYLTKNDSLFFKNGPIIQEGATSIPFQNIRKLEATSKYLRKISSSNIGISVLKVKNLYEITLGGYKEIHRSTMGMPGFPMGDTTINTSTGPITIPAFNPTFNNFTSYTSTKATFFDTVLDENFEHISKEFEPGIHDLIDYYMGDYKGVLGEDLFFHNDIPYYAYIDQKEKQFYLIQF